MNADGFRQFYDYHFAENRKVWEHIAQLSQDQYVRDEKYSHGSVRNLIVHLISADDYWFSGLRGIDMPDDLNPADFEDRGRLRTQWDAVEKTQREYLAKLQDGQLFDHPLSGGDAFLTVWQILLHTAVHAADHRAQLLRELNDLGVETGPQDYIFYLFDHSA